jgi:hypothetical protein
VINNCSTKSKIYEKEYTIENLQSELRKIKRENKLHEEKIKHLEKELLEKSKKGLKYKHIAK